MTLHSLEQPLADSQTLLDLAKESGITVAQARAFVALLADVPIRQAVRICTTAQRDRVRQINSQTRKSR